MIDVNATDVEHGDTGEIVEKDAASFPRIQQRAVPTCLLIDALKDGNPGDVLTDAELAAICGMDCGVGKDGYNYLMSAIRYCEAKNVFWERQRGEQQIKCLLPVEGLSRGRRDRQSIHRRAKRAARRIIGIDTKQLDNAGKIEQLTLSAMFGTLANWSSTRAAKKLEDKRASAPVNLKRLLDQYNGTAEEKADLS